jgi:hypothetical protein
MLAVVDVKRAWDKNYIEIKVDIGNKDYIGVNCGKFDFFLMHIYYFDSMSTKIREFRTVKSAEFYPASKYLLDPHLIPKKSDPDPIEEKTEGKKPPVSIKGDFRMSKFIKDNNSKFNES